MKIFVDILECKNLNRKITALTHNIEAVVPCMQFKVDLIYCRRTRTIT